MSKENKLAIKKFIYDKDNDESYELVITTEELPEDTIFTLTVDNNGSDKKARLCVANKNYFKLRSGEDE